MPNHCNTERQMAEITYLPAVECSVSSGFRESEVMVGVMDQSNTIQFLRVSEGFVHHVGGKSYLPIGVVEIDYKRKQALIELPHEADSGVNRLWVPFSRFRKESSSP